MKLAPHGGLAGTTGPAARRAWPGGWDVRHAGRGGRRLHPRPGVAVSVSRERPSDDYCDFALRGAGERDFGFSRHAYQRASIFVAAHSLPPRHSGGRRRSDRRRLHPTANLRRDVCGGVARAGLFLLCDSLRTRFTSSTGWSTVRRKITDVRKYLRLLVSAVEGVAISAGSGS